MTNAHLYMLALFIYGIYAKLNWPNFLERTRLSNRKNISTKTQYKLAKPW